MPRLKLDVFEVFPRLEQQAGVNVAKVGKPEGQATRSLRRRPK